MTANKIFFVEDKKTQREIIQGEAYNLWLEAGKPEGKSDEFWNKAEKSIAFVPMISESVSRDEIYVADIDTLPEEKVKRQTIRDGYIHVGRGGMIFPAGDYYYDSSWVASESIASGHALSSGTTATTTSFSSGYISSVTNTGYTTSITYTFI